MMQAGTAGGTAGGRKECRATLAACTFGALVQRVRPLNSPVRSSLDSERRDARAVELLAPKERGPGRRVHQLTVMEALASPGLCAGRRGVQWRHPGAGPALAAGSRLCAPPRWPSQPLVALQSRALRTGVAVCAAAAGGDSGGSQAAPRTRRTAGELVQRASEVLERIITRFNEQAFVEDGAAEVDGTEPERDHGTILRAAVLDELPNLDEQFLAALNGCVAFGFCSVSAALTARPHASPGPGPRCRTS